MKQTNVFESPFSSTEVLQSHYVNSTSTIHNVLAQALWNEPEDIATIQQRICRGFATEESMFGLAGITHIEVERELNKLISARLVDMQYGLYFLTSIGRQWAEKLIQFDIVQEITG